MCLKFRTSIVFPPGIVCYLFWLIVFSSPVSANCIAVITAGGGQGFWSEATAGAMHAGEQLNVNVYVRGAIDEMNESGQQHLIRIMEQRHCKGLVLAPNSEERRNDVNRLRKQGIPTVYIDRDVGGDRVSVIKTDNFSAGVLAGKEMVKAIKGQGKVVVFRSDKNIVTTTARENGFIQAAKEGGLEIVADHYLGTRVGHIRSKAATILEQAGSVDGIFTPNEVTSVGVWAVLHKYDLAGRSIHIGFDANKLTLEAVRQKQMYGLIVQKPFDMGFLSVYTLHQILEGKSVEPEIYTPVQFIDRDSINELRRL